MVKKLCDLHDIDMEKAPCTCDQEMTNEEVLELIERAKERAKRGEIPKISPLRTLDGRPKYKVLDEDDGYHD